MEATNAVSLGSSILVPSVQELVAKEENLIKVPDRYICSDSKHLSSVSDHSNFSFHDQIPVIDMGNLSAQSEGDVVETERWKFHLACKEWGFFQLINHGVNIELIEKVKKEIEEFFNMPMEEKKKYWQQVGDVEGFGQAFVLSEEQKLDWADMFYVVTLPLYLRKPHLFPNLPLPFRETLEAYSSELKKLGMQILNQMAKCLSIEENEMEELFKEGMQAMRMNYYPPCPQPELVIGLTPHSDAVGLTILLQVTEMEGLQVKKDGVWIPVKPLPRAFIVNIGDILEIVSNGMYRSIEHRATVNAKKVRISVATFLSPNLDLDMGPARSLISAETPAKFKRIGVADYFRGLFLKQLHEKSYLDTMRMENGHLD